MKEKIYTIPINEAFEQDIECPLCFIEKKLERDAVEYELGPAMMEPDHRELSNSKGYCKKHLDMMFAAPNKLPLALVLDTHLEEVRKQVSGLKKLSGGMGVFRKTSKNSLVADIINSCMVCDKLSSTMDRYYKVLVEMWESESEFRKKFENSKGFCLPHFQKLYELSSNKEFLNALTEKEEKELDKLQDDIHKFTLKFDYRNKDMEWGTAKDSPKRAVERLVGYIEETE